MSVSIVERFQCATEGEHWWMTARIDEAKNARFRVCVRCDLMEQAPRWNEWEPFLVSEPMRKLVRKNIYKKAKSDLIRRRS